MFEYISLTISPVVRPASTRARIIQFVHAHHVHAFPQ